MAIDLNMLEFSPKDKGREGNPLTFRREGETSYNLAESKRLGESLGMGMEAFDEAVPHIREAALAACPNAEVVFAYFKGEGDENYVPPCMAEQFLEHGLSALWQVQWAMGDQALAARFGQPPEEAVAALKGAELKTIAGPLSEDSRKARGMHLAFADGSIVMIEAKGEEGRLFGSVFDWARNEEEAAQKVAKYPKWPGYKYPGSDM